MARTSTALTAPTEDRYREARRVTLVGAVLDFVLGVTKLVVGWLAQSQALIADGIHSLSDLATDMVVLVAAKHANREADADHPYGHGRIETLATIALGAALILASIGIAWDAIRRLFHPELLLQPGPWALVVAALSVISKEWIYRYTLRVARRLRSDMLRANAWHSRSDAVSSVVVIIGVSGAMAGLFYIDAVAAVVVAAMIAKIGWDFAWRSARELIDTGLEPVEVERIRKHIMAVDGVHDMHLLRTRRMGRDALVDVHIQVSPHLSVSEGHQISEAVRSRLIETIDDVTDVMVHIDPEDDANMARTLELPLRHEVEGRLRRCWEGIDGAGEIQHVYLHYLDGRVHADVVLPVTLARGREETQSLEAAFRDAVRDEPDVGEVRLFYR
ncbi:MAG: cation transporter [Gammaproteobacteria bacterium]|nr:cation transporter [Gammaproteobacteria bacterium]NIR83311.1 cation transporter [Gammaproteobacteria bacterium]NIR91111.1 cation transporter [Gammaproteobacteria bacterium]NIU04478.1 cation transporter [Gammaproteobacteria bacterium]NIW87114.1 cation diffusion facilitator family transporter [Gammaproteobacteria bacterium]